MNSSFYFGFMLEITNINEAQASAETITLIRLSVVNNYSLNIVVTYNRRLKKVHPHLRVNTLCCALIETRYRLCFPVLTFCRSLQRK